MNILKRMIIKPQSSEENEPKNRLNCSKHMNITIFQAPSLMKFGVNLNMKTENSAISQYRIKKLNYSVSYSNTILYLLN